SLSDLKITPALNPVIESLFSNFEHKNISVLFYFKLYIMLRSHSNIGENINLLESLSNVGNLPDYVECISDFIKNIHFCEFSRNPAFCYTAIDLCAYVTQLISEKSRNLTLYWENDTDFFISYPFLMSSIYISRKYFSIYTRILRNDISLHPVLAYYLIIDIDGLP
ncbi:hypothetical protein MXB_1057, partial [Myxobolus squamalis]